MTKKKMIRLATMTIVITDYHSTDYRIQQLHRHSKVTKGSKLL